MPDGDQKLPPDTGKTLKRPPAWCDRVLFLADAPHVRVLPLAYRRHEVLGSDHRPVSALLHVSWPHAAHTTPPAHADDDDGDAGDTRAAISARAESQTKKEEKIGECARGSYSSSSACVAGGVGGQREGEGGRGAAAGEEGVGVAAAASNSNIAVCEAEASTAALQEGGNAHAAGGAGGEPAAAAAEAEADEGDHHLRKSGYAPTAVLFDLSDELVVAEKEVLLAAGVCPSVFGGAAGTLNESALCPSPTEASGDVC